MSELDSALSALSLEENVIVVGDFVIDLLRPTFGFVSDYLEVISKWGLQETFQKETRSEFLSGRLVESCLDHITVRAQRCTVQSAVVESKLADHYFVCCSLTIPPIAQGQSNHIKEVSITGYKMFDNLIAQHDWDTFLVNTAEAEFYDNLVTVLDRFREKATRKGKIKERNSENQ